MKEPMWSTANAMRDKGKPGSSESARACSICCSSDWSRSKSRATPATFGWYREGREFAIDLTGWSDEEPPGEDERLRFEVTRRKAGESNKSVLGAIGHILSWLDNEKPFDISLVPKPGEATGALPPDIFNSIGLN